MAAHTNGNVSTSTPDLTFDEFFNVINGHLVGTHETRRGINPSTLEDLPDVPVATKEDVDDAVQAAREAADKWAETPLTQRQDAVTRFADALRSLKDDFAKMLVREQGKPLMFARAEVDNAVTWLDQHAKLPFPEDIVEETDEKQVVTRYTPLGVALAIVPWNYPIMLACGKIGPALVSGNALIVKPSPFTPYCGLKLVELAQAFFPPGVIQVLSGNDNLGPWLTAHPLIDKVSFTGSTATGKRVMESCSKTLKRVTLELVYVHSSIYEEFLAEVVKAAQSLLVGDGFEQNVYMGPIQNAMQYERVTGFMKDIEKEKWKVAMGGEVSKSSNGRGKGYFINPTVIDNPPDESRIVVEEPFGPSFASACGYCVSR
ncbi:hypothetical protein LTR65_002803 [Meristemomyces frigidus]